MRERGENERDLGKENSKFGIKWIDAGKLDLSEDLTQNELHLVNWE